MIRRRPSRVLVALGIVLLSAASTHAEQGFLDVFVGGVRLFESDIPDGIFSDAVTGVGARAGVWLGRHWGLALRGWYQTTDVRIERHQPSDLAVVGLALEVFARWPLTSALSLYGAFGPALLIATLDLDQEDARSLAPGVTVALGIERALGPVRLFIESQLVLAYPSFEYRDRTITPQLFEYLGVVGLRVPF
jgi:hypothetical protein